MEIPRQRGEHGVVARVEVVDDSFGQSLHLVEPIEVFCEVCGQWQVAHRVVTGVASQSGEHAAVVVAQRANVHLHRPALLGIHDGEFMQDQRAIAIRRGGVDRLAFAAALEGGGGIGSAVNSSA